jgi:hypothetical protein
MAWMIIIHDVNDQALDRSYSTPSPRDLRRLRNDTARVQALSMRRSEQIEAEERGRRLRHIALWPLRCAAASRKRLSARACCAA